MLLAGVAALVGYLIYLKKKKNNNKISNISDENSIINTSSNLPPIYQSKPIIDYTLNETLNSIPFDYNSIPQLPETKVTKDINYFTNKNQTGDCSDF